MLTVRASAQGLDVHWRYPLGSRRRWFSRDEVMCIRVFDSTDSDGDPYYRTRVALRDGTELVVTEGHFRHLCEISERDLVAALQR